MTIRGTKAERIARMSPENRAAYERIKGLREEIGPTNFDVTEAIRELRTIKAGLGLGFEGLLGDED